MNEDAFARRFYADRSELEALGIQLSVDKPVEGLAEQENYSLRAGELPPAGDRVHRRRAGRPADRAQSCSTASSPTPSRCGSRSSRSRGAARARCRRPSSARSRSASPPRAGGHDLSQRLAKIETAIFRRKTIDFDYYTMQRDELGSRKVDPYQLLFQGGQFYLVGRVARARGDPRLPPLAHPRQGRLRVEGRARLPAPRATSTRAPTRTASSGSSASRSAPPRCGSPSASPGRSSATSAATARSPRADDGGDRIFRTEYADAAPARRVGARARRARAPLGPPELVEELDERVDAARRAPRAASRARRAVPAAAARERAPRRAAAGVATARTAAARGGASGPSASRGSSRSPRS